MSRTLLSGMLVLGVLACTSGVAKDNAEADKAAAPGSATRAERTLAKGTRIGARIQDSLSSRRNKAGETVRATVSGNVEDARGYVVIPSGSAVELVIGELEPSTNKSQDDGKIALTVKSVTVRGQVYQLSADVGPVQHQLKGRGVTAGEVEKVGIGAAAGAVAGQVIGGNAKGAVIGGVIGAAGGTAAAVHWASRDVVVTAGTPVVLSLYQPFSVTR